MAYRFGSGDGERENPTPRQMPHEPLPASVFVRLVLAEADIVGQFKAPPSCETNSMRGHRDPGSCADT